MVIYHFFVIKIIECLAVYNLSFVLYLGINSYKITLLSYKD